jgi:hypothetical protein
MRIEKVSAATVTDLWARVEPQLRRSTSLEDAAQKLVKIIYEDFTESVVLARVFCTIPFDALPARNRRFVQRLVDANDGPHDLGTATPVLSLVGTYGTEQEWRSRINSQGHLGVPLVSADFVDAIPMISRLLKELGVPLEWADSNDSAMIQKTIGRTAGLFFVENAVEAVDHRNRKIIAAEEFVHSYGIRGVFGAGGGYVGGQIVVLIVFCRDTLPRSSAECFMALTALFKAKTSQLVGAGKIFAPE